MMAPSSASAVSNSQPTIGHFIFILKDCIVQCYWRCGRPTIAFPAQIVLVHAHASNVSAVRLTSRMFLYR